LCPVATRLIVKLGGDVSTVDHAAGTSAKGYRPTGASLITLILALVCFGGVILLHLVRGEIHPLRQVMSDYANGSHGPVMTIVFYGFGLAAIALAIRLRHAIKRSGLTRPIPALLGLAGVSMIAAGVFEVERPLVPDTFEENIHSYASIIAFVLTIGAMFLFSFAARQDHRWWGFRWVSAALAAAGAGAAMLTPVTADTGWSGAVQRLLGLSVLAWFVLVAAWVRRRAFNDE
jgi:hypothetical protein